MEYEFRHIEESIRKVIGKKSNPSSDTLSTTRKYIDDEKQKAKKSFILNTVSIEDKQKAAAYVQYHQYALTDFIDELFELSKKNSSKNGSRLSMEIFFFYDQLEDLLNFIGEQFPEHFCRNAKIPEPQKERLINETKRQYSQLKSAFHSERMEQLLASVCSAPISRMIQGKEERVSYKRVAFVKTLICEFKTILGSTEASLNDEARKLLLSLDYNDESYFKYYTDFIRQSLSQSDCTVDQLEKLALHHKLISQCLTKPESIYDSKNLTICEQLIRWIQEEFQYLEKKQQLAAVPHNAGNTIKDDFKIEVDMSVSQFACLIKVFIESGIIQNKNISELIRFLSKFVKTKRSESISNESFRIKYYDVESGTKHAVRNLLHTAISYINSN